jgi:amylosucrase
VADWFETEAERTLGRIMPRALEAVSASDGKENAARIAAFSARARQHFPRLFRAYHALYASSYDFHWQIEKLLTSALLSFYTRDAALVRRDEERESGPRWFEDHRAMGGVLYVDRFAGTLDGVRKKIPYFKELGLTYLHLMPLFRSPPGDNDGGYAVSDYREVDARLGTMADLGALARELKANGVSLVVDFILNHTADDHPWAEAAKAGDPDSQAYYFMFDDRREPNMYQPKLRAIFPDRGSDAFTWRDDVAGPNGGKWVWTTFYRFQWDLNYRNPALFNAIAGEAMFLANQGIDVLRLDAVPFLWKSAGTTCENQPEAHFIVEALNAVCAMAAPSLAFKSEAIVHPDEVVRYIGAHRSELSYNPLMMALLWEAIATRSTNMLNDALKNRYRLPPGTAWINYLRSHDDIGWGFANEDALRLGVDPEGHRRFLNAFYTGRFAGTFARGLPFQDNPETGDCRVCGTLASLAGLEAAIASKKPEQIDAAVNRILAMQGIVMTAGGIPLVYLGDEVAQLNDYEFGRESAHAADSRWVHRPIFPEKRLASARKGGSAPEARIYAGMLRLVALRKSLPALGGNALTLIDQPSPHVTAYLRENDGNRCVVLANLSEHAVSVPVAGMLAALGSITATDRLSTAELSVKAGTFDLAPYGFHCFTA